MLHTLRLGLTLSLVARAPSLVVIWPLHNIAITNSVWCMAYTGGVGWGAYIAQKSWNSIAMG